MSPYREPPAASPPLPSREPFRVLRRVFKGLATIVAATFFVGFLAEAPVNSRPPLAEPAVPFREPAHLDPAPSVTGHGSSDVTAGKLPFGETIQRHGDPPRRPVQARPDCDPPYQVDAKGRKHFKVQCL